MEVDLVALILIMELVAEVLMEMYFTSQKKFWEGYEVSPNILTLLYVLLHIS